MTRSYDCVLQCVAVYCSVLLCCSELQCVTVCCSVLQCVAVCCSVVQILLETDFFPQTRPRIICLVTKKDFLHTEPTLKCVAMHCNVRRSVLQYVAVCCSVLQCVAVHKIRRPYQLRAQELKGPISATRALCFRKKSRTFPQDHALSCVVGSWQTSFNFEFCSVL